MKFGKRFVDFWVGIGMLLMCGIMMIAPKEGYFFVIMFLDIGFLVSGFRMLVFYFTIARYMADGHDILYKALIRLDVGLFIVTVESVPQELCMLYLIGMMAYTGAKRLLKTFEAKKLGARSWRRMAISGGSRVLLAVISLFYLHSFQALAFLYCIGLLNTAAEKISRAFRKTAVKYVQV